MSTTLPNDPIMLFSVINTQLRDHYENLTDLCKSYNVSETEIIAKLKAADFVYDPGINQFV